MSNSNLFKEAQDSLYQAARYSADFALVKLTSEDTDFSPADKERLKVALSVLKITWSAKDNNKSNKCEGIPTGYKSNEYGDISIYADNEDEYGDTSVYTDDENDVDDTLF
jgi:hypothetical protein